MEAHEFEALCENSRLKAYKKQYDVACFDKEIGIAQIEKNWQLKVGEILVNARALVVKITKDKRAPGFKQWYETVLGVKQRSASRYMQLVPLKAEVELKGVGKVMVEQGMTNAPQHIREKSKTALSSTSDSESNLVPFTTKDGTEIQISEPDKNSNDPVARGAYHRQKQQIRTQLRKFFTSSGTGEGIPLIGVNELELSKSIRKCTSEIKTVMEAIELLDPEERIELRNLQMDSVHCYSVLKGFIQKLSEEERAHNAKTVNS